MILVSACLLGINCKYNGDNNKNEKVEEYLKEQAIYSSLPRTIRWTMSHHVNPSEIIKLMEMLL